MSTITAMLFKVSQNGSDYSLSGLRKVVAYVLLVLQLLVFAVVLCPLAALYLFGLLITTGLSLWRLIQRDYGKMDNDAAKNLELALNMLYSLALIQGVLFFYYSALRISGRRLANIIAGIYGFEEDDADGRAAVMDYMRQTRNNCQKDPSSVRGRNLVTFAVELMKPESSLSSGDYLSGARILDKLLSQEKLSEQHALIRQLVGSSASSTMLMEKLLQRLHYTCPLDHDVRVLAARIVAHLAGEITLTRFPQGIRCICSLLDMTTTTQGQKQDDHDDSAQSDHYKELMVQGLDILYKLVAVEDNCRIIINTTEGQHLLSKAMAPVSANLLHRIDHEAWSDIVQRSLQLMSRLVAAPGETGDKLRSQVLNNSDAISTMNKILNCEECTKKKLYILAIKILTKLPMAVESTSSMSTNRKEKFISLMVAIFTDETKDTSMRQMAGEALAVLSDQSESNATIIFKARDNIVNDLTVILLDVSLSNNRGYRKSAAEILEHLYIRYKENDAYLKNLTEAMKDVLPKVLTEIFLLSWTQKEKGTNKMKSPARNADIERQGCGSSHDNADVNEQTENVKEKKVDRKLYAALLSLSVTIFGKLITNHKDLDQLADKIAPGDTAFSFAGKLKEVVEGNSKQATANCLRILKITTRMIISLINLEAGRGEADMDSLMQSLSKASKTCCTWRAS
ncbi:hypothetical protein GUJ93_ZPchr0009g777 [Zizania palustris]|uniref:Uncharacterized protein n=1 Tax=Zizania palustris TaxID=103762 RepID=A0A8J5RGZ1_ZIZPA|nr:hypothetical protein GUJ93_ZPchr0009g777 [Zizania palustris]